MIDPALTIDAYGMRDDVIAPDDILSSTSREIHSDPKYKHDSPKYGEGKLGRCFICVHDSEKSWADRMKEYSTKFLLRKHGVNCLPRLLNKIQTWIDCMLHFAISCEINCSQMVSLSERIPGPQVTERPFCDDTPRRRLFGGTGSKASKGGRTLHCTTRPG
jgi:hypothetical protein